MSQADNLAALATNVNSSGVLQPASGGTGAATLTANNVLLGNGTSALQTVAPGTNGNLLTSNGTTWTSAAPPVGMVYPGAGIPNSTGSAWSTSYTTTGSGTVVALATSPSFTTPILGTPQSGNFSTGTFTWPTFNQNTTGTAATATNVAGSGITGSRNIPRAAMPAGSVLQVVSNFYNTTVSFTGTAYNQFTGLDTTITPTSSTSRILIIASLGISATSNAYPSIRLTRNGTAIALSTTGTGAQSTFGTGDANTAWMNFAGTSLSYNFVDSPATGSAVTYGIQISPMRTGSQTVWLNRTADQSSSDRLITTSSITLMEIAV